MDRRGFLKSLALLGLAAATPKIIFDLGAKKYTDALIWKPRLYFCGLDPGEENLCNVLIYTGEYPKMNIKVLNDFYEEMKHRRDVIPCINGYYSIAS